MHWMQKIAAAFAAALAAGFLPAGAAAQEGRGDVVYVPTPQIVVDEMLRLAKIGPQDFLIDLGSGDGRIVITAAKKFGAQGFGVDLDSYLLGQARAGAQKEGVSERARFVEQNLFETDLSKATVVSSYLLPEMNLKLRPKILALKPGTRVVAHDYHMGEWLPDQQADITVPEKVVGTPGVSYIYLWIVPSKLAGKWQTQVNAGGQPAQYELAFDQSFQILEGTLRAGGASTRVFGRVNGDQVTFATLPKGSPGGLRHEFSGRVVGDTIEGTVRLGEGAAARQAPFTAKLTARGELRRASDERGD
ncbi:MAG TPA: class I SAM-dependent methyltransferase [Burkholderiales bacterium]|nr:class I SAM-dependent methyltransferase [Burkholderiales bacterium]